MTPSRSAWIARSSRVRAAGVSCTPEGSTTFCNAIIVSFSKLRLSLVIGQSLICPRSHLEGFSGVALVKGRIDHTTVNSEISSAAADTVSELGPLCDPEG